MYIYYNKNNKNTVMISEDKIKSDNHGFVKADVSSDEIEKIISVNYDTKIIKGKLEIVDKKKLLEDEIDKLKTVSEIKEYLKKKLK